MMERIQDGLRVALAIGVGAWHAMPQLTQLLILLMGIDIVLGVTVAIKRRDLSSVAAWDGVTKKLASLLLVGVAGLMNPHVQGFVEVNLVQAASAFYIVPELTSIARNAAILDVPVFVQLTGIMRYFQAAAGTEVNTKPGDK